MKSAYRYMAESWQRADMKKRLIGWRAQQATARIARPSRPDRARALGWKAKQGFAVVRVRIGKGLRKRPKPMKGRKPGRYGRFFSPKLSLQAIAEQRAARRYRNMEVLNSYYAGEDGTDEFYEVMLIDRSHPAVLADKNVRAIAGQHGRAFRGLTSAGKMAKDRRRH